MTDGTYRQIVYVVRSEIDGNGPGYEYDDEGKAKVRANQLNAENGLPNDHRVEEEIRHD